VLMKRWLNAAPKSTSFPTDGTQCTNIIRMNWVLGYPRARRAYNEMLSKRIWMERRAKVNLVDVLRKNNLIGKPSTVFFGKKLLPFAHKDSISDYDVGDTMDMLLGPLDDLRASLARFEFRILACGMIIPIYQNHRIVGYNIVMDKIGVYVFDSYDFNDGGWTSRFVSQPLGFWDVKHKTVGKTPVEGNYYVTNETFRKWRQKHKKGGDFKVFSDIKFERLNPAENQFEIDLSGKLIDP
jgi:hypothetical protein